MYHLSITSQAEKNHHYKELLT